MQTNKNEKTRLNNTKKRYSGGPILHQNFKSVVLKIGTLPFNAPLRLTKNFDFDFILNRN